MDTHNMKNNTEAQKALNLEQIIQEKNEENKALKRLLEALEKDKNMETTINIKTNKKNKSDEK